jgi:DNA-binding XRE family transcriptional regulator
MENRLKEARVYLGLTKKNTAEKLGISCITYNRWETQKIPIIRLYLLCEKLNINRIWLETGEGEMFIPQD